MWEDWSPFGVLVCWRSTDGDVVLTGCWKSRVLVGCLRTEVLSGCWWGPGRLECIQGTGSAGVLLVCYRNWGAFGVLKQVRCFQAARGSEELMRCWSTVVLLGCQRSWNAVKVVEEGECSSGVAGGVLEE